MSTVGQPLNFEAADPAAPSGAVNVVFQADAPTTPPTATVRNISAYMPPMTATTGGAVPTPPNVATKYLNGQGAWTTPAGGGGGGSNDDISYYLSPATITPPSGLSWAHQVNGTVGSNANGAAVLSTYGSGANLEVYGASIAAEDFDSIGCFAMCPSVLSGKETVFAIALWDSVSGKMVSFQVNLIYNSVPVLQVAHWPSFTGAGSNAASANVYFGAAAPIWLRINCSRGQYTFYVSVDGQSWDQFYQESTTAYMTNPADHAGIGVFNTATSSSNAAHLVVPHFVVNSYVGS
jgi:hypothetical protein